MSNKDFEVKQILKAYRKGIISESMLQEQMEELSKGGLNVANVLVHKGTQVAKLQETPMSQTVAFTLPAGYAGDKENTHKGDQIIYAIEGSVTARVSGKEQDLKAGDLLMIPAGAPHTLRTDGESFFGFTILAPPEL
jgi:quercetin dioxygenase-like cupin family protein